MPPSDNIERLEAKLRAIAGAAQVGALEPRRRFDKIEMRNVVFSYIDKSSEAVFQVGPFNFTLHSGDLVFITGGNGSGKSTFLKLLAGLYKPDSGEITARRGARQRHQPRCLSRVDCRDFR